MRARVAEQVYASDLKSDDFGHTGSIPVSCTNRKQYAYLLGCYLGDGYINSHLERTWKLRIACDAKYPEIVESVSKSMREVFGNNVNVVKSTRSMCVVVYTYSKLIPQAFPQHGVGYKHMRSVVLTLSQVELVKEYPWEFVRGLYHSDGSRYIHTNGNREYVKYNFTNKSRDIIDLFCWACDLVDVKYTVASRPYHNSVGDITTGWTVTIGRKSEVEKFEHYIGPKS